MNTVRLVFLLVLLSSGPALLAQSTPPGLQPCSQAEQKQLDFWIGEWKLTWPIQKAEVAHGSNSIKRALDGCVVEESFSGESSIHLRGHSVSIFDAQDGKWKQTWVDNEGGYLDFVGGMKDGQMSFWRETKQPDGTPVTMRMIWRNVTYDSLDWSWEGSTDGEKSWKVLWAIHYERKK
jgi:hypothetical protein